MLKPLAVSLLLVSALMVQSDAQGVCVPDQVTINSLQGLVVYEFVKGSNPNAKTENPVLGASLELREDYYDSPTIATSKADVNGRFEFKNVKPGEYQLTVKAPNFVSFTLPVRVMSSKSKQAQKVLIVNLGSQFTIPCGGGFARLRDRQRR